MQQKKLKNLKLLKNMINRMMPQRTQKDAQRYHKTTLDIVAQYMTTADVQYMTKPLCSVAESNILNRYAEHRAERCQKII